MTLALRLGLAAALLLAAGGCSSDQTPGLMPADESSDGSPAIGTPEATEAAGDPLSFTTSGGRTVFSCFPKGFRRFLFYDTVRADREVTLTGLTTEAEALRVRDTFVAALPRKAVGEGGTLDLDAGGVQVEDIKAWPHREPLEGAVLEPGTRYTFFAVTRALPDRSLDDLVLAWDDGESTGTSSYDNQGRTRSGGC